MYLKSAADCGRGFILSKDLWPGQQCLRLLKVQLNSFSPLLILAPIGGLQSCCYLPQLADLQLLSTNHESRSIHGVFFFFYVCGICWTSRWKTGVVLWCHENKHLCFAVEYLIWSEITWSLQELNWVTHLKKILQRLNFIMLRMVWNRLRTFVLMVNLS